MNPEKDVFENSEEKWNFIIALIVIAVFSVFIYQYFFKSDEIPVVETSTDTDESQTESKPYSKTKDHVSEYVYVGSKTYELKKIKTEDSYLKEIDSAVIISDITKNKSIVIDTISGTKSSDKKVEESIDNQQKNSEIVTPPKEELVVPKASTVAETPVEKDIKKETETLQTKTKPQTSNTTYNCVIVVGVFREQNNRKTIIKKLKSLGYNHSEGSLREGMSYVGVPTACNDEQEKQKLLKELNIAFGIDSWIKKL
ncbi:SPOR domain-containing protein [Zobellia uliginosa]|uniref:SPOR domain-containing protein n=1 Tax=Zobellia uliginosa TaxID=143224 RepID=UPI001C078F6B|nr:hypothetical protein [Zobellia uliginosa]MBU2948952.1 hypothetical protein [Zobellia uliginosa]